jgi:hypothetical protein
MVMYTRHRPARVTLLALLTLIVAGFGGIRLGESIFFWKTLIEYGTHPLYTAISGAFWLGGGLLLVWGLWRGRPWAWRATVVATMAYPAWFWLDRVLLQRPHMNDEFTLISTAVLLLIVLSILFTRRTREYLQ